MAEGRAHALARTQSWLLLAGVPGLSTGVYRRVPSLYALAREAIMANRRVQRSGTVLEHIGFLCNLCQGVPENSFK